MESDMGWVISWPVSHKFCLSANHFSDCLPYSNMKQNEYGIFEYCKNLYSSDALFLRRSGRPLFTAPIRFLQMRCLVDNVVQFHIVFTTMKIESRTPCAVHDIVLKGGARHAPVLVEEAGVTAPLTSVVNQVVVHMQVGIAVLVIFLLCDILSTIHAIITWAYLFGNIV